MTTEITNEQRARVFASYLFCEFRYSGSLAVVRKNGGITRTWAVIDDATGETFVVGRCQLLLTPLSSITDEHAIEVHRMLGFEESSSEFMAHKGKWHASTGRNTATTDLLRSLGYNLGYGKYSPEQLIELGIVKLK